MFDLVLFWQKLFSYALNKVFETLLVACMDDGIPSSGMWIYLIPKAQLGASLLDLLKYAGKSAFMVAGCANIHNDGDVVGDGFTFRKGSVRVRNRWKLTTA